VAEGELGGDTRLRRRLRLDTHGHYLLHARAIREWRRASAGEPVQPFEILRAPRSYTMTPSSGGPKTG
jgi:hypothetical protein